MRPCDYQYGFSEAHAGWMYDTEVRRQKAKKLLAVAYWMCPTYLWLLRKPAGSRAPGEEG